MTTETVFSPVKDEKMNSHLNDSEVWKNAYHPDDMSDDIRKKYPQWYMYKIKFDGLKPIQMTKIEKL
jgi:hypothetical protein